MTGLRLSILDISLGVGVDINAWSDSELSIKTEGPVSIDSSVIGARDGYAKITGGTTGGSADVFRFKAMGGLGVTLGPIKLDVPITYYFDSRGPGANVGITGAFVW